MAQRHRFIPSAYSMTHGVYFGDAATDAPLWQGNGTVTVDNSGSKLNADQITALVGQGITAVSSIGTAAAGSRPSSGKFKPSTSKHRKKGKKGHGGGSTPTGGGFLPWAIGGALLLTAVLLFRKPKPTTTTATLPASTSAIRTNPRRYRANRRGR